VALIAPMNAGMTTTGVPKAVGGHGAAADPGMTAHPAGAAGPSGRILAKDVVGNSDE
jgi:hypothetical protein